MNTSPDRKRVPVTGGADSLSISAARCKNFINISSIPMSLHARRAQRGAEKHRVEVRLAGAGATPQLFSALAQQLVTHLLFSRGQIPGSWEELVAVQQVRGLREELAEEK